MILIKSHELIMEKIVIASVLLFLGFICASFGRDTFTKIIGLFMFWLSLTALLVLFFK